MFEKLPKTLLYQTLKNLPTLDIFNICQVSKHYYQVCKDDNFWTIQLPQKYVLMVLQTKPTNFPLIKWYNILYPSYVGPSNVKLALLFGVEHGYYELVKHSVEEAESVLKKEALNEALSEALNKAVIKRQYEIIKYLVEKNSVTPRILTTAVSIGDKKMFGLLLKNYQDLNHALELAAGQGWYDSVVDLVESGADINTSKALSAAVKNNQKAVVEYLVRQKANITQVLDVASSRGNVSMLDSLLQNMDDKNNELLRRHALIIAVVNDKYDIVVYLIEHGLKIDISILEFVVRYDRAQILEYLLRHDNNIENDKHDLFMLAIKQYRYNVVKYFVKQDVKLYQEALRIAESDEDADMINYLESIGNSKGVQRRRF